MTVFQQGYKDRSIKGLAPTMPDNPEYMNGQRAWIKDSFDEFEHTHGKLKLLKVTS